jgi:hypothetical protein
MINLFNKKMSWLKWIEIDCTKGQEDGKRYSIHLWGYFPDDATEGYKKGDCIGSVSRETSKTTFDDAKKQAGEVWGNWVKKYPGSMIQIWIHPTDVYPPRIGKEHALMYADNFKHFAAGTKQSEGTPF